MGIILPKGGGVGRLYPGGTQGLLIVHLRGCLGILHTTTLPCVLHLGFLDLGRPSGEKFLGLLGIPSGETPASTEGIDRKGKIDPVIKNSVNNFFITSLNQLVYILALKKGIVKIPLIFYLR